MTELTANLPGGEDLQLSREAKDKLSSVRCCDLNSGARRAKVCFLWLDCGLLGLRSMEVVDRRALCELPVQN